MSDELFKDQLNKHHKPKDVPIAAEEAEPPPASDGKSD